MNKITSTAIPLPQENIDTDQIIPARFLKAITREGFGEHLFEDWRKDKSFILNDKTYTGEILVAGRNFGCGSSREHAAWALKDYGFNVVISSFFADIFKSNALNNFLLPLVVSEKTLAWMFEMIKTDPLFEFTIDLEKQTLSTSSRSFLVSFDIDPYKKLCLKEGYSDMDYLLEKKSDVEKFEKSRKYDFHVRL
ncbi:MAG: 3-isopropylmalate dehydratase small subunit [bacterium]|nr:3-isopropylmalate dehydratase small subunit [bacterium]